MSSTNEQLIEAFCGAWERRDVEEILGYFADDAVYHNMPMEPAVGFDAIRAVIESFVPPAEAIEFTIHHIVGRGDLVFTERTDTFTTDGKSVALPVVGVFELHDGKIAAWRDYFDMQTFVTQSA